MGASGEGAKGDIGRPFRGSSGRTPKTAKPRSRIPLCDPGNFVTRRPKGCSMFVLIAEITWVATVFLQLCVRHDHRLWKYWTGVTWFSDWKKSLVYVPMSVIPVLRPHGLWLAYLAGGQLLALALCHFLLTFRTKKKTRRRNKGRLLQDADSFESSKFEEITECLDDGLPEPMPGSSHSLSGGLVEREAVLEI
ncbi:unnamed protein product [Phyllotreta striolata]|uniref:Uncharacterized protein n=1 Tax=Phyllotreta striolata TaxID=444603 RepID=A0A9N9XPT0_PHYSR|nr:unnamed protein product [Phyllotreta striolata]